MIAGNAGLQREIRIEKEALLENLSTLESKAREMMDWRVQFDKRPWQAVGAAVVAGALLGLIVGRRHSATIDEEDESVDAPVARRSRSHPVIDRMVKTIVGIAATQALEVLEEVVSGIGGSVPNESAANGRTHVKG